MKAGLGLALAALTLGAGKAMEDLKEMDDSFSEGRRKFRLSKNKKKVDKKTTRHKNKLARAARKKNRK